MKKIETGAARPETFPEQWPGQCEVFSHLEYACGIPSILYAVTTYKENGLGNVCCGAWASFPGDGGGFYVLVPLPASTHTLANSASPENSASTFFPSGTLTRRCAPCAKTAWRTMSLPRAAHAGARPHCGCSAHCGELSHAGMQSRTHRSSFRSGRMMLVKGRVLNAVSAPDHAQGVDKRYGPEGFVLNINEPRNLLAHHSDAPSALATLHVEREYQ